MSDVAPAGEPRFVYEDSRRLTGPNRWFDGTAVVLSALSRAGADAASHRRWAEHVRTMCRRLQWPEPQPLASGAAGHRQLAFAAPEAALFTATEVNEWAWERAAAAAEDLAAAGFSVVHPVDEAAAAADFAAKADDERSPPLQRLQRAARQRGLPCLVDDDSVSLGAGQGSRTWPRAALPLAMDVPWGQLHDVPTVLVTGSNGKTTTTRLLAAMFAASGQVPGLCSTEGVWVGGQSLAAGDYAGPAGARRVLRHAAVQAAVLETARGGLLRRGLAVTRADAAVVTNVSEDHLGEYGIASVDDIAAVKLIVARALGPAGTLVLNGADERLCRVAMQLPHVQRTRKAWFALTHEHARLVASREQGDATCGVHDGRLLLSADGLLHDLGAVAEMPLSLDGAAIHNVENIAAAVLAGCAAGLAPADMATTLAAFGSRPGDNPGRLERWPHHGATVFIDYAHNPDGLDQLLRVARALQPRRLGLLLGQAGNRDDTAIAALARTAAGCRPDRVVLKELPLMQRGRGSGEVTAILQAELLRAGLQPGRIHVDPDEESAARSLLAWAAPGDVVVLPIHTSAVRDRLLATIDPISAATRP